MAGGGAPPGTLQVLVGDEFWASQRVLVIAPHADDEAYGCAGTIAKVKAAGGKVYVLCASVGDLRHYSSESPAVSGTTRADELRASMEILGVDGYEILFTDAGSHLRLDAISRRDLMALIERDSAYAIDRVRPTVIVLPAASYNQDHEALFAAGFAACRPHLRDQKPFVNMVLACDAVQLGWRPTPFHPNVYVDISEYLGAKLDALACHKSQLRPAPDPGSLANVERLARLRGAEIGVDAAEGFECYRIVL
jgi:LmbE family N-acetylglucosaminyl deacetylase